LVSPLVGARAGRIGGTAFSFLYLAIRALLGALVRSRRGLHVKDIELLVLRQELEVLRRQVARPTFGTPDWVRGFKMPVRRARPVVGAVSDRERYLYG
jgi:hypothetical protein